MMDVLVYGGLLVLCGFTIWMVWRFFKEWPSYSRKNQPHGEDR